jgi:hypothetical protein
MEAIRKDDEDETRSLRRNVNVKKKQSDGRRL